MLTSRGFIFFIFWMGLAAPLAQAEPCGTVLVTHGLVEVIHQHPRSIKQVRNADSLECGDFIITKGKDSSATLEFARGKMIVGAKTRIEIASTDRGASEQEVDALNLIYGRTRVLISRKTHDSAKHFEVRTPSATVGVRGTDFFVEHDAQTHVTREATVQGVVEVTRQDSKEPVKVPSGQEVTISTRPEDSGKTLTPQILSTDLRQEIKTTSVIAEYDPDFTHKDALRVLGRPKDWNKTVAEEFKVKLFGGSQYQHQAENKVFELTPAITYGSIKYMYSSTSYTSTSDTVMNIALTGEYGFSRILSGGVKLAYAMDSFAASSSSAKLKASGLADPGLFINGRALIGPGLIRYGALLSISPDYRLISSSAAGSSSNEYSGGVTLNHFVGYEIQVGRGIVGARLSSDLIQTGRKFTVSNNGTDTGVTVNGGQSIAGVGFTEWPVSDWLFGGDIGMITYSSLTEASSNSTPYAADGSQSHFKIDGYVTYHFSDHITALGDVGYGPGDAFTPNFQASGGDGIFMTLATRFGF